jgi:hypothetical protein
MRLLKRSLIVFFGLVALPAGVLAVFYWMETVQSERFYAAHPVLRAMRDAPPAGSRSNDPWPEMTTILLEHVPTGSTRSDALRILGDEGLNCTPSNAPTPNSLACWTRTRPSNVPRWYVEVKFDQDDKVSGGRVLMLKATTT